jgi:subtilisin family serine protease
MKEKITTCMVLAMLLIAAVPMINVYGIDENQRSLTENSQSMPQQKISSQLLEKLKEAGINGDSNEPVRILIRHDLLSEIKMPEGVEVLTRFNLIPIISALSPISMVEEISRMPGVEYVYSDLQMHVTSDEYPTLPYPDYSKAKDCRNAQVVDEEFPTDPYFGQYPTFLNETTELIGARELWAEGITGENVIISIIDTGINKYHPDLDDMDDDPTTHDPKVLSEASFVPYETPDDSHGHGTHVASTAAGTGATGAMGFFGTFPYSGIFNATILPGTERGVAPGAYLYNAKAFDSGGSGYDSWIIEAIEWSVAQGADVISGSFGGWPTTSPDEDPVVLALKEAINHGVVVVIAAGNDGWGYFSTGSPGFAPDVITVGATTETDELAYFSSRGPEQLELHAKPDIVAPGTCVVAALYYFREIEEMAGFQLFYWEISGTSMATPHVSGVAALLLQAFPGATPYSVKAALMQGAEDLGLDPMAQGAGRIDVKKAYDIMNAAPKAQWAAPLPTDTIVSNPPAFSTMLNLTGKTILFDTSYWSRYDEFMQFFSVLDSYGAYLYGMTGPYTNDSLVDPGTGEPYYDVFIIPKLLYVDTTYLPPGVLDYYVNHNGTVLFIGDAPLYPYNPPPNNYDDWTEIWGITWNNTAVGGYSSHMTSHSITNDVTELYFGSPISSLIVNASMQAETVVWDPIFPAIAVWETPVPAEGKVVVISDDGVLNDLYLYAADNLKLGLNIIQWFTGASEIQSGMVGVFFDNAEFGTDGWTYDGLWHITDHRSSSPSHAWYYGQEGVWNFDTGVANRGNLISPTIDLTSATMANLAFKYWYETETTGTSYDQRWIDISVDGGPFAPYVQLAYDSMDVWLDMAIGLTGFVGHVIQIQFRFDTIDDIANDLEGWYIDDVAITAEEHLSIPLDYHEIGVGGTWPQYVIANTTATISVNVTNFGTYTEDVELYMNGINVQTINNLAPDTSTIVELNTPQLNATLICDESGANMTSIGIWGSIADLEIDYTNNGFVAEIAAVPKGERKGDNPLLSVMTPMKIDSTSAPLITMYPEDFTLHNMTAFVGGGELVDATFQITGNVSQIADFMNVTEFAYHVDLGGIPDPSPAYFKPNMTAIIGDTLSLDDVSAPAMLFAELQVYVKEDTPTGTYTGQVRLMNGTTTIASASLSFEVKNPKYKVLWEDYYNDYGYYWYDCERLWGGAVWGYGVFEWWKLASQAGFDVDSLHQQVYCKQHIGYLGTSSVDPLGIIAYGGYDALYLHDVDFNFNIDQISVFRQLYETGKMDFVVLFDGGSEALSSFTSYYGISASSYWVYDLVINGIDKTHPIFNGVQNFTLYDGPLLTVQPSEDADSVTTGIATGTDDWGIDWASGFTVAVNEMHATPHLTSRMVAVSDSKTFEYLEYADFMVWYWTLMYTGEGEVVSEVDTDKFAVNMLGWVDPQFANEPPAIDYFDVTPTTTTLGDTVNIDVVAHDPEDDSFNVTIAVRDPDDTWNNATVPAVGGHWLRSFTTNLEGEYDVYVIATDSYEATTTMLVGTVNAVNMAPEIVSASISPSKVVVGEVVFITVTGKDAEDITPAKITLRIIDPEGSSQSYNFTNVAVANVVFDSTDKPEGIYQVEAMIEDTEGASITADIGLFEVKPPPSPFSAEMATLGVGIIGLVVLIIILLLIFLRFPGKPKTPP